MKNKNKIVAAIVAAILAAIGAIFAQGGDPAQSLTVEGLTAMVGVALDEAEGQVEQDTETETKPKNLGLTVIGAGGTASAKWR
jgi:hypothetical protein